MVELKREDMVGMLKEYLKNLNREYKTENGGLKHLAEQIIDNGEEDCSNMEIQPVRKFAITEEGHNKETGMTMTAHTVAIFSHVEAVEKKIIKLH
jgi:hypothetical protein